MTDVYSREIKRIRNKLSRYTRNSLIVREYERLGEQVLTSEDEVRKVPWLSFLLIELIFSVKEKKDAKEVKRSDLDSIMNVLWKMQSYALESQGDGFGLAFRRFMATQYLCQRDVGYALRNLARISVLFEINGRLDGQKSVFFKENNISLDRFIEFVFILVMGFGFIKKLITYEEIIDLLYPYFTVDELITCIRLLSGTAGQIESVISNELNYVVSKERYAATTILTSIPILRTKQGLLIIHGTILDIGLSEIIHNLFNNRFNGEFKDKLGKALEDYTAKLCLSSFENVLSENDIKEIYLKNSIKNKKVTDLLVDEEDKRVFIEVKATDPGRDIAKARTKKRLSQRLKKKLLKGVIQVTECNETLNKIGHRKANDNCYAIVISYKDFYISTGADIQTYTGSDFFEALQKKYESVIPTENIHYMSIEDFECLCLLGQEHGIQISDFLDYCTETIQSGERNFDMRMYLDTYCQDNGLGEASPFGVDLLKENNSEPFSNTINNLKVCKDYWSNGGFNKAQEFYKIFGELTRELLK